jgi:hypothetical protein
VYVVQDNIGGSLIFVNELQALNIDDVVVTEFIVIGNVAPVNELQPLNVLV